MAILLLCGLVPNIFSIFFRGLEVCLERCDSYGVVVVFRRASGRGIYASDHTPAADYRDIDSQAVSAAGAANPATVLMIALMLYAHRLPPLQTLSNGAF